MNLRTIYNRSKKAFVLGLATLIACGGLMLSWAGVAQATTSSELVAVVDNVVDNRAERELDRMTKAGSADQIKGNAQEALGKAQRALGDDSEGIANQAKGKANQGIGQTKQAADDAEDSAESLVDKARDFFN